jgi:putative radical SAM enzyme (TIGR03279 family)
VGVRPTYGTPMTDPDAHGGGVVARIEPGSPADQAGIAVGDRLISANGRTLTDVIAWWWESEGESVSVSVQSAGGETAVPGSVRDTTLVRAPGESWGIDFTAAIFDRVRTCVNRCAFCFMAQLPQGLRPALYLRDDDYRLSFLAGNFITLTNLGESDVERIVHEHLSPLHVSLHAVSSDVRARLLCAREDRALDIFDQLVEGGIDLHVQIVLVPDENDGDELQATLAWLAARDGVRSVGIVPLGYTDHQDLFERSYTDPDSAAAVLDAIDPWSKAMRARDGIGWVYAADEFYLTSGRHCPLPRVTMDIPSTRTGSGSCERLPTSSKTG